jgi:hypothetical protein
VAIFSGDRLIGNSAQVDQSQEPASVIAAKMPPVINEENMRQISSAAGVFVGMCAITVSAVSGESAADRPTGAGTASVFPSVDVYKEAS